MFRPTFKKKQKKAVTRLRTDSDDEDETKPKSKNAEDEAKEDAPTLNLDKKSKKSKTKKKGGLVIRSFEDEHDEDENKDRKSHRKKSKKRKRAGLGFGGGGGGLNIVDDDDMMNDIEQADDEALSSSLYGKGALEKLKAEQKYKVPTADETTEDASKTSASQQYNPPTARQSANGTGLNSQYNNKDSQAGADDFVPLPGGKKEPSVILTGDEAMVFEQRNLNQEKETKEDHFDTVMEDSNLFTDTLQQEQAAESSAWEAEIVRRAGIHDKSSGATCTIVNTDIRTESRQNGRNSSLSLAKLRNQIQSTVSQLETQKDDVERACQRRRVELTQTKEEFGRQEKELEEAGKALEDYQELREQMAFWTGALRDLKSKVQPIQEALIELDSDVASNKQWQDWEDDMCSVLHQAGLLDKVLGRQPPDSVFEDTTTIVDEFGRDVKSQQAMHREKRTRKRFEIRKQRQQVREDESDDFNTEHEIDEFCERLDSLGKALNVAIEDLEEEYLSIVNLSKVFHQWKKMYPEDYKQCYANLSLGDLAGVLVQVDLCKVDTKNSRKGWLESMSSLGDGADKSSDMLISLDWVDALADHTVPPTELVDRLLEKVYIPTFNAILDNSAYNALSKNQSRSLGILFGQLSKLMKNGAEDGGNRYHEGFSLLINKIVDYIKASFDNIAVVILKSGDDATGGKTDMNNEELKDALRGATIGQLHRLSKMLRNVLLYWLPHFPPGSGKLLEFLLDFISSKFLSLLSSQSKDSELTSAVFSEVYSALKKSQILDQPELMLHAAPVRAAAVAYNLM